MHPTTTELPRKGRDVSHRGRKKETEEMRTINTKAKYNKTEKEIYRAREETAMKKRERKE